MTKARIIESNHTRALYTFELCEGEIGYLEVLDNNELEVDDVKRNEGIIRFWIFLDKFFSFINEPL